MVFFSNKQAFLNLINKYNLLLLFYFNIIDDIFTYYHLVKASRVGTR